MQFPSDCIRPPQFLGEQLHCYARIFARVASNPGPLDYSFDDINDMLFTTLLSAQIAEW